MVGNNSRKTAAALAIAVALVPGAAEMLFSPVGNDGEKTPEKPTEKTKYDIERIRAAIKKRKRKKAKRMKLVKPPFEPRYDEVYEKGVEWLDSL